MSLAMPFVTAQAAPAAPPSLFSGSFPLILIAMFAIMYFTMIRPQSKRQKEMRVMIAGLRKGDEVVTNGGMVGRVDEVDDSFITLEVAPNVKVKVQKWAVSKVLPRTKAA